MFGSNTIKKIMHKYDKYAILKSVLLKMKEGINNDNQSAKRSGGLVQGKDV